MQRIAATAACMLLLTGCDLEEFGGSARFKEDFHHSFPLQSGGRVYLENLNGPVEVSGWDRESCDVSGTKHAASRELLEALRIDIIPAADSIRIRTARPSGRRGNVGARYVLRVPKRAELERIATSNGSIRVSDIEGASRLRTSNGAIRALNLRGPLEARTSNGSIEVDDCEGGVTLETSNGRVQAARVRGSVVASTSNSGIRVHIEEPEARRPVRLTASNGGIELTMDVMDGNEIRASTSNSSITVRLPASAGARVKASTSNGSVSSDFDVRDESARTRARLEGTIGGGGPLVDLSTSNGSIRLRKTGE